ncbi:hypothetical protein LLE49_22080 [Alicyclobacillus tolerans]|uniref:hypothetical protein n=1 Tax=Alicyclobacillus tolerans TaxID=90970 RepID=UPI001F165522|nr:hypothetical protein [Alicyclobacillus tolerans]MCF8567413.1 hypothetical protein [Alicyclobacillus tolerans]
MSENPVYVNITSEGARLNPQILDNHEHAIAMFLVWRSNDTVMQTKVATTDTTVKYYVNTSNGQEWKEEAALTVQYGSMFGYVPLSESGFRNLRQMERYFNRYVSVVPDRYVPNSAGESVLLFSRRRALEIMQGANLNKIVPGTTWTAVITARTAVGYTVNIGGYRAWLPLSLVDHHVVEPYSLQLDEMIQVKITENVTQSNSRRLIVSKKDAMQSPFDLGHEKYRLNARYAAEILKFHGRFGYAALPEGILVRVQQSSDERGAMRTGTPVKVRLKRRSMEDKMFIGEVEDILR